MDVGQIIKGDSELKCKYAKIVSWLETLTATESVIRSKDKKMWEMVIMGA